MIIAHRGESFEAPENSLTAINKAWKLGAEAVEVDVHLTSDNKIVVIHDKHTGRTGDKKLTISKTTLEELQHVDIGIKKSTEYKGEKIPTLEDILNTIPPQGKLIIEIKSNEKIIQPLINLIKKNNTSINEVEFISFNLKTLSKLKKEIPEYKMLWLIELDYYWPYWILKKNKSNILKKLEISNLDGINVWAGKMLNKEYIDFFKKEGYSIYTWTVNDPIMAKKLINYGIDAITTDRASWLNKQLEVL